MPTHAIVKENQPTPVAVYQKKTILTNSEIISLPTVGIELLPAPGAGKQIMPISYSLRTNTLAGQYTNLDSAPTVPVIAFGLGNVGGSTLFDILAYTRCATALGGIRTNFLTGGIIGQSSNDWDLYASGYNETTSLLDQPLLVVAYNDLGNFEGGDEANTMEITVVYAIIEP